MRGGNGASQMVVRASVTRCTGLVICAIGRSDRKNVHVSLALFLFLRLFRHFLILRGHMAVRSIAFWLITRLRVNTMPVRAECVICFFTNILLRVIQELNCFLAHAFYSLLFFEMKKNDLFRQLVCINDASSKHLFKIALGIIMMEENRNRIRDFQFFTLLNKLKEERFQFFLFTRNIKQMIYHIQKK